jgi:hypothetical protein
MGREKRKNLTERYANKPVNPDFYGKIKFSAYTDDNTLIIGYKGIQEKTGYVYAPYIPVVNKAIITDKNGTRTIWQISRWKRFKLWIAKLMGKLKEIE